MTACDMSNNVAENSILPFVVGRKNREFSTAVKGAESRLLLVRDIGWKILVLVIIVYGIQIFCTYYQIDFGKWFSWAIGLAGLFGLKLKSSAGSWNCNLAVRL